MDPAHYISSPGLCWDAMLKRTGVKLDLLSDVNMYQFIEKGMRGGTSYISHRYARANNKYMSDHDPGKPSSYIMYYDANNLYGWAMSEELPYGKFKWISGDNIDLDNYGKGKEKGLILEVDLEYKVLSGGLVAVKKVKEVLLLNKPAYIGMSILDISKTLMYDFHYNHIRKLYGNRAKLLFTDSDSLMYRLSTPDAYEDALKFASKFDTSGYSKDSPFYNATNKKVIAKMKDEVDGVPIR